MLGPVQLWHALLLRGATYDAFLQSHNKLLLKLCICMRGRTEISSETVKSSYICKARSASCILKSSEPRTMNIIFPRP